MMDDRVIEAAAMAILTEFGEVPYYRDMAESAIKAADAVRADDVRAAVERLMSAARDLGFTEGRGNEIGARDRQVMVQAMYDLLALIRIEE